MAGTMIDLINKIKSKYPKLTNKRNDLENYVYIVKNEEILVAIGRSSGSGAEALTGNLTHLKHTNSGISMMASSLNKKRNIIFYVPVENVTRKAEIDKQLNSIEKTVKKMVREHYDLTDNNEGGTYCNGMSSNKDIAKILKTFLVEKLSREDKESINELSFSFEEVLELVNEDEWSNLMNNKKALKYACVLLGKSE
jgi:hypothetical protein